MMNYLWMDCRSTMDKLYEFSGDDSLPLLSRLEIAVHIIFCPRCAGQIVRLNAARSIMKADFFPAADSSLEDVIMEQICAESVEIPAETWETAPEVPFQGWVAAGLIVLFSLAGSFFGGDFANIATSSGSSFLLPVGITIGGVVTAYGAIFIGSHLKELSDRFGLH
ncbi:hypothetical protein AGMMS49991_01370 [Spirochaetia bacterium]|nr:hypothetical protein AGMMS49991_01370 [Spirochaetia bacterium]